MKRRNLLLTSAGLVGIAGCTGLGGEDEDTPSASATPTDTATSRPTDSPTATGSGDATDTETETATDEETETEDEGPGYKSNHWHGRLFLEVDGELVDFNQPKYFLDNIEDEDAVYFHFHEGTDEHGPNEWSNEKQIVTFERALNLLPGISYEQSNGNHAVTYEGTTYDGGRSGTAVSIHEGTERIDPTTYEVEHDDNFWVQATSGDAQRNVSPAHDGADLGTLVFDINNHRVDFSRDKYLGEEGGTEAFHFHDDGNANLWYKEGSITLAEALNGLTDVSYEQSNGNHVVEYKSENHPPHSRRFDGGRPEHEITIRQRSRDIDPTSYEPAAGDIIWIYVHSTVVPDNEH
jgi:hypothetical protein